MFSGLPPFHPKPVQCALFFFQVATRVPLRWFIRLFFLVLAAAWAVPAMASVESDFRAARENYMKGRFDRFESYAARIPQDSPFQSYLGYWRIRAGGRAATGDMLNFLTLYPQSPLAEKLRADLALFHAKAGDWPTFRTYYQALIKPSQELLCHDLNQRFQHGERDAGREGAQLWHTGKDLPDSCLPLFEALFQQGRLTQEDRYQRLRLALNEGNLRLAQTLNSRLPADEQMSADALPLAQRRGDELLQTASPRRGQREAALYALTLFAKLDPEGAARLWEVQATHYPEAEQRYGWGQIALHAARKQSPRALEWFARSGPADLYTHEAQSLWRIRAALRAGRWLEVYQSIHAMPAERQEESVWRYWKARAMKGLNAPFPANAVFAQLSHTPDYYGLLALEELPPRLESRPAFYVVTPDDLKAAEANPALQLALALRKAELPALAQEEWNHALRSMTDRQLLGAAELALRHEWHDRAIHAANQTKSEHNFDLRYIAPYRDLASTYARENDLDEAWVFGLIRQESRFTAIARSRVGAQGLMQIMPATARWIARELGLDRQAHARVGAPDTNIRFGTYYLKRIYDALQQSPVLATAAYNAGPGRARRWQADTPLEGAVYVESIPFLETREYVKRVLTNAMFYRSRFGGETRSLRERLGVIPPRQPEPTPDMAKVEETDESTN